MSANLPQVVLSDIVIRQDDEGRYCLNDLHRAAGAEQRHRPKYWLANQQTQDMLVELTVIGGIPPISTKPGVGTFVVKELVYHYAMWISARFNLQVIRAYDKVVTDRVALSTDLPSGALLATMTDCTKLAELVGLKGNQAILSADVATRKLLGVSPLQLLDATHLISHKQEILLTPTDIGARLGIKAQEVNVLLAQAGLQTAFRTDKGKLLYAPTKEGEQFGVLMDTTKKQGDGTPVQQLKWYSSVVEKLASKRSPQ